MRVLFALLVMSSMMLLSGCLALRMVGADTTPFQPQPIKLKKLPSKIEARLAAYDKPRVLVGWYEAPERSNDVRITIALEKALAGLNIELFEGAKAQMLLKTMKLKEARLSGREELLKMHADYVVLWSVSRSSVESQPAAIAPHMRADPGLLQKLAGCSYQIDAKVELKVYRLPYLAPVEVISVDGRATKELVIASWTMCESKIPKDDTWILEAAAKAIAKVQPHAIRHLQPHGFVTEAKSGQGKSVLVQVNLGSKQGMVEGQVVVVKRPVLRTDPFNDEIYLEYKTVAEGVMTERISEQQSWARLPKAAGTDFYYKDRVELKNAVKPWNPALFLNNESLGL